MCSNTRNTAGACSPRHGRNPLTRGAQRFLVSLVKTAKLMEDQCLLSQSNTVSTVQFVLKWPEEARGHLPLVPSSVGLPQSSVSGREGVTWRWDPACAEGSNTPAKGLQPLPTQRGLCPCSPQSSQGSKASEALSSPSPQLSIPTSSSAPGSGGCHSQAGRRQNCPRHCWGWRGLRQVVPRAVCCGDGAGSEGQDEYGPREGMCRYQLG